MPDHRIGAGGAPTGLRPQRVAIPTDRRGTFFAATAAAAAAFAVFGVFNSLMPAFLAGTMHETSYAVAGAIAFAATAGTAAQIAVGRVSIVTTMKTSLPVLFAGLALFSVAMCLPNEATLCKWMRSPNALAWVSAPSTGTSPTSRRRSLRSSAAGSRR
jgi:hypothetical protein